MIVSYSIMKVKYTKPKKKKKLREATKQPSFKLMMISLMIISTK